MTKKKPTRESSVVDAPVIGSHVCVARETLIAVIAAADGAANGSPDAPALALETIRALVAPYLEAE